MYKIFWKYFLSILVILNLLLFIAFLSFDNNLRIIGCDVGQGDSFLIIKGNTQVLIDGGPPNGKAIVCLSEYLPFWDNTIELVVNTHPEQDHFGGLIEVFEKYKVKNILKNSLNIGSEEYRALSNRINSGSTNVYAPTQISKINIGLIHFDIVWPTKEYFFENTTVINDENSAQIYETNGNLNDFSIVLKMVYKNHKALFTGDIGPAVISDVIMTNKLEQVEYIKVPHHGSRNGLTEDLLKILKPKIAAIGVGKNQWGHPHKEVLDLLEKYNVQVFRTDQDGNFVLVWD